ncbi:MAG: phosphoribosylformylglycinamidine synthase [Kiritimatiellae bacterium]|nr:phosphoribosylformylglycinamidine synthase [Kiritimatiellia bacterium]MDD5520612.1 phosphoribosylformylglycinamidine synthase [Kiritimatiellia bacterium]
MLKGKSAYPNFRITALLENVRKTAPDLGVSEIEASHVYFMDAIGVLSKDVLEKAYALLGAVDEFRRMDGFIVTPRKGTISPWSSKATDIFRNCGIKDVWRVERGVHFRLLSSSGKVLAVQEAQPVLRLLHDRMTEGVYLDVSDIFRHMEPAPCVVVDIIKGGREALQKTNVEMGLALSDDEITYLYESYKSINRNPTDVELVMFGQVNSEHCRHKIFNADWIIDGKKQDMSLFKMIKNTHAMHPEGTLVAYKDNAGVVEGFQDEWFNVQCDDSNVYSYGKVQMDILLKVETHNHPIAISPYPGAATGVGGEIRDESATGIGGKSKAGLCAFMVSNLRVPGFIMPWEKDFAEFPSRLATPLEIMTDGPLGGAGFGNEFGRPNLFGLFKTYEQKYNGRYRGYHKPIMVAGGMGNIKRIHTRKHDLTKNDCVVQIGGPAMRIGLGGGAASSMDTGSNALDLDFNSVQRDNAEMQKRCQEVIDDCIALGKENPILSIHDIGAGGLSNGCPELVSDTGGKFYLRRIHNEDKSMSPMEIWCCEAQERYVLAVAPQSLANFFKLCERERCPVAVIGEVTGNMHLSLEDEYFENKPIDIDIKVILGKPPKMLRDVKHLTEKHVPLDFKAIHIKEAIERVLRLPAVANKTFLITIADRSVTGMVARDQMVGPYQTPISDAAVTITSYKASTGEVMTMGERTNLAIVSGPASGRMAIGEAITNIAGTNIGVIGNIKLSANWMCACSEEGEDAALFDTVRAVGMELCPKIGVSIPVGKDSLSMRTLWQTSDGKQEEMIAPLSLVVSAFSPVKNVRKTVTPDLKPRDSKLLLVDLGRGKNRLGCSALAQVYSQVGNEVPDVDNPPDLVNFFNAIQELVDSELLLAYHDRSDGGLMTTLSEMAFGGRMGFKADISGLGNDPISILFSEELGAVLQIESSSINKVESILKKHFLKDITRIIGSVHKTGEMVFFFEGKEFLREHVSRLYRVWSELTYRMQARRDNPECAKQEFDNLLDEKDPGMCFKVTYDYSRPVNISSRRPRMAILREQGVNGHVEMAAAFDRAGFESVDVHMTDLLGDRADLKDFEGLVACGGFSYGDVLGAGSGWAKCVLYNDRLKEMFRKFFARKETFALGVCNGCQMVSQLKGIIPGAEYWPMFTKNKSQQFEARYITVEIMPSPSIFFRGMEGSRLGIAVAHGEGFANFESTGSLDKILENNLLSVRFIDNYGKPSERYPFNPNGSVQGITSVTTTDGRVTVMMPHPERGFRSIQMSYRPEGLFEGEEGPWLKMFQNARKFVA